MAGYIDSDDRIENYNGMTVYRPDVLKQQKHFIFVALENYYPDVLKQLTDYGLLEFRDYLYPTGKPVTITGSLERYFDLNGNEIDGLLTGQRVELSKGSKLVIGRECRIDENVVIRLKRNGILIIGDQSTIASGSVIDVAGGVCYIGSRCCFRENMDISCGHNSVVRIGDDFSSGPYFTLRANRSMECTIGRDCMFSADIRIQCDGHNYYDFSIGQNVGMLKDHRVTIGDHVWVGAKANLLYGADIASGCIVGFASFVNKKFPANSVLAGHPARIVRENVAWRREAYPFITDEELFKPYRFISCDG